MLADINMKIRLISFFGSLLLRLLLFTTRFTRLHYERRQQFIDQGKPTLSALWHAYQLMGLHTGRSRPVNIMVSRSRDGEILSQIAQRLGYKTIRGSSHRGGNAALKAFVEKISAGESGAITVDGPRGPAHQVKPGILMVASKSGVPILPWGFAVKPAYRFKSWDRFCLPLPFSRIVVSTGEPFYVPPDLNEKQVKDYAQQLKTRIDAQTQEAEAYLSK